MTVIHLSPYTKMLGTEKLLPSLTALWALFCYRARVIPAISS